MVLVNVSSIFGILILCIFSEVRLDGERDHGEACSFRTQVANYFRTNDKAAGCMTEKGLLCLSRKCVCDPTSVYEQRSPTSSSDSSSSGGVRASIGTFLKKVTGSETTTTPPPSSSVTGGRCVGRSGSPCLTANATCVEHATCQGSPKLCRCQGIYSSNSMGLCSKRATIANEALKRIVPGFSGRRK